MSKVYSFRLRSDNPREALAIKYLEKKYQEGYSLRYILCEAILCSMELNRNEYKKIISLDDLLEKLDKLDLILDRLESGQTASPNTPHQSRRILLKEDFIASIRKASKPGLKIG